MQLPALDVPPMTTLALAAPQPADKALSLGREASSPRAAGARAREAAKSADFTVGLLVSLSLSLRPSDVRPEGTAWEAAPVAQLKL
jgi:hypothetical protein